MSEKKIFILRSLDDHQRCAKFLNDQAWSEDEPPQVVFTKGSDLKSIKQNSLYWKHIGEISKQSGENKIDLHRRLKRKHLHPILLAGKSAQSLLYQINYEALMTIHKSQLGKPNAEKIDLELLLDKILSIKDATVKQMSEYIDSYWPEQNGLGYQLTDPSEYMEND